MIKKLLEYFGFCQHIWEVMDTIKCNKDYDGVPEMIIYIQKCTKCGKLQQFRVK